MESASEGQSTSTTDEENRAETQEAGASAGEQRERRPSDTPEDGESQQPAAQEDGANQQPTAQKDGEDQEGGDKQDGDEDDDSSSNASIAWAVEDVSALVGETVNDQDGRKIGEVKEIYAIGEDESPMWVTIESATGLGRSRGVFVPLARIKKQADEFRVPYSYNHIHESPEVEPGDELSEEDDRALRAYYAIGLADQELVGSARSYASQVPDGDGPARKVEADSVDGPAREIDKTPPAERVAEAYEKQKEEEGEEHRSGREATAEDVFEEDGAGDSKDDNKGEDSEDSERSEEAKNSGEDKSEEQPKGEEKQEPPKGEETQEPSRNEEKQESGG